MDVIIRPASGEELGEAVAIDDDACNRFERAGLRFSIEDDHPFALAEYARWRLAADEDRMFFAWSGEGHPVGLLVLGFVNGEPHVEQLSVREAAGRQGIGARLLSLAIAWAGGRPLWLETYAHVAWNRPFYERHGFVVVQEASAPAEVRARLAEQRRWLPAPEERVAMCKGGR